jgi:glycosyltransferase involved in cell wall biosynthesis
MFPLISIIVPVFNVEKVLPRCIDSILSQDHSNWELYLVDDGSSDFSGKICDEYAIIDSRIHVIHQKNGGVSVARNAALDIIKGEFVTFIDADDWIEKFFLSEFLKEEINDHSIVMQGVYYDYGGEIKDVKKFPNRNHQDNLSSIIQEYDLLGFGLAVSKLYSVNMIREKELKFDTELRLHEDHIFFLTYLLKVNQIVLSTGKQYHYMHEKNVQSLSKKLQKSTDYFKSSNSFIVLLNRIEHQFIGFKKDYIYSVMQQFGLNQRIMGIFALYNEDIPKKERISIIKKEKKQYLPLFKKVYRPNTLKMQLFLFVFYYCQPSFADFIFRIITKSGSRLLKKSINIYD